MKYILILTAIGFLVGCASTQKIESARQPQQVIGEVDAPTNYKDWAMQINQKYLSDEAVHRFSNGINKFLNSQETKNLIQACHTENRFIRIRTSSCTHLLKSCLDQSDLSAKDFNSWYFAYDRQVRSSVQAEIKHVKSSSLDTTQKNKIVDWLEEINYDFETRAMILGNRGLADEAKFIMSANNKMAHIQKKGKADFMDNKIYAEGCIQSLKDDLEKNKRIYKSVTF
jgi:acyl-homoserine lactone acylase PvdQ